MTAHTLDAEGVVLEGYSRTRPFSSFLPGIAGLWGLPMWVFYVNRGQGIAGFGIQDKDHPIMEFQPANKAYRTVPLQGFRTFLKIGPAARPVCYEPFRTPLSDARTGITQRMRIRMHELVLEERNTALGLEISVRYFTIPHAPVAALARVVTITNRGRRAMPFELVDGLPVLIPHGMLDRFLKQMSRTIEAWVAVQDVETRVPFYRLKVEPDDRPEVVPIRAGNFFLACTEDGGAVQRLAPVVDPAVVFGRHEDFTVPERFLARGFRVPARQITNDKTPSAMAYLRGRLAPGSSRVIGELFGHVESRDQLHAFLPEITAPGFFARKTEDNRRLIEDLTGPMDIRTRSRALNLYCRQTYLDNLLRGGHPTLLGATDGRQEDPRRKIFYVFSRKHGDLERDYNQFVLPATPFSQGNANYRDVNQNRRTDVWFHPEVDDHNIITFFNLLQTDGYNPLIFKGIRCVAAEDAKMIPQLADVLSRPFTPGELLQQISQRGLKLGEPALSFLNRIISRATTVEDAEHGEGFWSEHWTYNLDLLESYLGLYPDRLRALLLEKRVFTFYDNAYVVAPRHAKYQHTASGVRQFHAVRRDREKAELIRTRTEQPHCTRTEHGRGAVYTTTLLVKMLCVLVNKLASLDPSGLGVEMEADKPNWYDALNGLPGLMGSSLSETFELKRWGAFLLAALEELRVSPSDEVVLPAELHQLLLQVRGALELPALAYWQQTSEAKEAYREQTRLGLSGQEQTIRVEELRAFLTAALAKIERALTEAFDAARGLYPTYFYHHAAGYTRSDAPQPVVTPTRWSRHTLPLFLEGLVHALRVEHDPARAKALHEAVKKSPLYDAKLKMYRVCDSLQGEVEEIGRCRIFTPGWLENQSIWLHMEYKYLLELLRAGLHEAFYQEFFAVLIPFQPAKRYGRSILENSSFLISSVYPDAGLHGNGFVARLSGATAELLQMWLWMAVGRRPFRLNAQGRLELALDPALSERLFDAKGALRCRLLGATELTYLNPSRRPTFGPKAVRPARIRLVTKAGARAEFGNGIVPEPFASQLRRGLVASLEVELASLT